MYKYVFSFGSYTVFLAYLIVLNAYFLLLFFSCIFLPSTRLLCPNCNMAAQDGGGHRPATGPAVKGDGGIRDVITARSTSDSMTTIVRRRSQGRPPAIRGSVTHIGRNTLRWSVAAALSLPPSPPPLIWHRLCTNRIGANELAGERVTRSTNALSVQTTVIDLFFLFSYSYTPKNRWYIVLDRSLLLLFPT